jgi:hypothetical protein
MTDNNEKLEEYNYRIAQFKQQFRINKLCMFRTQQGNGSAFECEGTLYVNVFKYYGSTKGKPEAKNNLHLFTKLCDTNRVKYMKSNDSFWIELTGDNLLWLDDVFNKIAPKETP